MISYCRPFCLHFFSRRCMGNFTVLGTLWLSIVLYLFHFVFIQIDMCVSVFKKCIFELCSYRFSFFFWSQIIQDHSELQLYIGLDVDPVAHEKAQSQIYLSLNNELCNAPSNLKTHTLLKNFKYIKSALREVNGNLLESGVDGILMDLGLSSMQVCLFKLTVWCFSCPYIEHTLSFHIIFASLFMFELHLG